MLYQSWLPDDCLNDPKLAQPINLIMTQWSGNWFASSRWSAVDRWIEMPGSSIDDEKLALAFQLRSGPACWISESGKSAAIEAMLNIAMDKDNRRKLDIKLLTRLVDKALKDLAERLESLSDKDGVTPMPV